MTLKKLFILAVLFGLSVHSWGGTVGPSGNVTNPVSVSQTQDLYGISAGEIQNLLSQNPAMSYAGAVQMALSQAIAANPSDPNNAIYQSMLSALSTLPSDSGLLSTMNGSVYPNGFYFSYDPSSGTVGLVGGNSAMTDTSTTTDSGNAYWTFVDTNPIYQGTNQGHHLFNASYSSFLAQAQSQGCPSSVCDNGYYLDAAMTGAPGISGITSDSQSAIQAQEALMTADWNEPNQTYIQNTISVSSTTSGSVDLSGGAQTNSTQSADMTAYHSLTGMSFSMNANVGSTSTTQALGYTGTNTAVQTAVVVQVTNTPIVLDLEGYGRLEAGGGNWLPHRLPKRTRVVMFDFYGDGFPVAMEWVGPHDGLLVKPKTDGSIDGTCLFGNADGYSNGFEKLKALDKDGNGVVEGKELEGLYVWQDKNQNGKVDAGELMSVQSLGITKIYTHQRNFVGVFTLNGKNQMMWDWFPNMARLETFKTK